MRALLRPALLAACLGLAALGYVARPEPAWRFAAPAFPDPALPASFETAAMLQIPGGGADAPALIAGGAAGDAALLWREGGAQSRILGVTLPDPGAPVAALTPESVSDDMVPAQTVLALGPAVGDGTGGLFATAETLGGARAGSVVHLTGQDGQIASGRQVDLSPLLGRGHSVAAPGLTGAGQGGGQVLPVRFEMLRVQGAVARLDGAGRARGLSTIPGGAVSGLVALSEREALAILSVGAAGGIALSRSEDGGRSWSAPEALDLPGGGAATSAAALALGAGRVLMVAGRDGALVFLNSGDGAHTWAQGPVLESDGALGASAPVLSVLGDGRIALAYAVEGGAGIAAHVFTQSWAVRP